MAPPSSALACASSYSGRSIRAAMQSINVAPCFSDTSAHYLPVKQKWPDRWQNSQAWTVRGNTGSNDSITHRTKRRIMRDFNDLYFFAAVVKNEGFSAAARGLSGPQSRVSRRIAILEEQLGVRLLERSTRRLSVTEIGRDVYRHARAMMDEVEAV